MIPITKLYEETCDFVCKDGKINLTNYSYLCNRLSEHFYSGNDISVHIPLIEIGITEIQVSKRLGCGINSYADLLIRLEHKESKQEWIAMIKLAEEQNVSNMSTFYHIDGIKICKTM